MRFIVALLALLASDAAMAQHQTFRDANGRTLGRSTTDARGNTTYYDSMGRSGALRPEDRVTARSKLPQKRCTGLTLPR